jgi:non-canonical (house-cleaning) NTP pyrophosphatase
MEGGRQQVGDRWFECGWIAVINREGRLGLGSSARFELSPKIMKELHVGRELAEVIDALTGQKDVHTGIGAMGMITNGHLPRAAAYEHGLLFAFGRFISDQKYWE